MASIEREIELGLLNATSGVSGLNQYTSERSAARLLPSLVVEASLSSEELGPFSGVFRASASLTYTARADATSRQAFDQKFQSIMGELYRSPDLPTYMTNATSLTVFLAKVSDESPQIIARNRTWAKTITLDISATAKK